MELLWKIINPNSNAPITGGAAGTALKIRRSTDGYLFDFNDSAFKTFGWLSLTTGFSEVDAINLPGVYQVVLDTASWADGEYQFDATYSAGSVLLYATECVLIQDGIEAVTVGTVNDKTGYALSPDYDAAKTALSASAYLAPDNATITAIDGKVEALGTPMQAGTAVTLTADYDSSKTAASQTSVNAIAAKTDNLPADPASNTQVNTRLAAADYVAPDNATITDVANDVDTALSALVALQADMSILTGGAGTFAVTLQLYRTGTQTPITDVAVSLHDSNGDVVGICQRSSAGGLCLFALNAGSYTARLLKSGYIFAIETVTVSADMAQTIYGEPVTIPLPGDSESCTIYEYCFDQASQAPLARVTASAAIVSLPYNYAGRLHSNAAVAGTYSAATGVVSWDVVRGAVVAFTIKEVGVARRVTIPNAATARLADIR